MVVHVNTAFEDVYVMLIVVHVLKKHGTRVLTNRVLKKGKKHSADRNLLASEQTND